MSKTQARTPHCSLNHVTMFSYNTFAAVMLESTPITGHHYVCEGPVCATREICDLIRFEQTDVDNIFIVTLIITDLIRFAMYCKESKNWLFPHSFLANFGPQKPKPRFSANPDLRRLLAFPRTRGFTVVSVTPHRL